MSKSERIEKEFNQFFQVNWSLKETMVKIPKNDKGRYLYKKLDGIKLEIEHYLNSLAIQYAEEKEKERENIRKEKELYSNVTMFNGVSKEVMEE